MPQSNVEREMERSFRPWLTNETTSLRAEYGRTKSGSDLYSSSRRSWNSLSLKK
jgi:hypothetical protein